MFYAGLTETARNRRANWARTSELGLVSGQGDDCMSPIAIDPIAVAYTDEHVLQPGPRTILLRTAKGGAVVHYCGKSHAVSVDTEAHSRPSKRGDTSTPPLAASDEPLTRGR